MQIEQGNIHLTYCTNIHPAEDWQDTFSSLAQYCLPLKKQLAPDTEFGIGLRLSNRAASELLQGDRLPRFQAWLAEHQLYVFTINGFPFGDFHQRPVQDRVYAPDWQTDERSAYTVRLARILAALLPPHLEGSISTLPLSYRPWFAADPAAYELVYAECCRNLALLAAELARIRQHSGKLLHLGLEPEPDCLLDCSSDVILFYNEWLLGPGRELVAASLRCSRNQAEAVLRDHIRICYDACHFALARETPASTFRRLAAEGIGIGKVQLSSALKVVLPPDPRHRHEIASQLREFADDIWLHQVTVRNAEGACRNMRDLRLALPYLETPGAQEWRIHFHVPLFLQSYGVLSSTQAELIQTLQALCRQPLCSHLEIETYTWSVLPAAYKCELLPSIEREYRWVMSQIAMEEEARAAAAGTASHSPEFPCREPLY